MRSEFGVIGIGIFGSVVRGEQRAGSDIDILVEFDRPVGFVRFMRLEKHLAELVQRLSEAFTTLSFRSRSQSGREILPLCSY